MYINSHTYIGKKTNKMALTKKQKAKKNRNRMAKKTRAELYKKGLFGKKS